MQKLWNKNNEKTNVEVESFLTKDDLFLDNYLIPWDIYGSMAHAYMLSSISILTENEYESIVESLLDILDLYKKHKFTLQSGDEDVHTKIENHLTEKLGEVGEKIHTGRSRNDQVLLDLRLYSKHELLEIWELTNNLSEALVTKADEYKHIPMPGYTHMQKGMPSSVGMWLASFAEALQDDLKLLKTSYNINNQSPLGSGASYGVSLPLYRELVANLLGFNNVQANSLYCQNSRGKIEGTVIFSLMQLVSVVSKFASDLLLFTTSEFNFFEVAEEFTTGSSIMPQKKNIDVAEVLRGKVHILNGYFIQIYTTVLNLPSGYNRDVQLTKKPYIEAIELTKETLSVAALLVQHIKPKQENLLNAMTTELYATDSVYDLVKTGIPFREAYRKVGKNLDQIRKPKAEQSFNTNTHLGSVGNLGLNQLHTGIINEKNELSIELKGFNAKIKSLEKLQYGSI